MESLPSLLRWAFSLGLILGPFLMYSAFAAQWTADPGRFTWFIFGLILFSVSLDALTFGFLPFWGDTE